MPQYNGHALVGDKCSQRPAVALTAGGGARPQIFGTWPAGENRVLLADVISLLAMTMSTPTDAIPESLKYRLLGTPESLGQFGHEYVRNLAGEIGYALDCRSHRHPPCMPAWTMLRSESTTTDGVS